MVVFRQMATIDPQRAGLKRLCLLIALVSTMALHGCAVRNHAESAATVGVSAFYSGACQDLWEKWTTARGGAGITSPWGVRSPAIPLLRGSRVLAASLPADTAARNAWLRQALDAGLVALDAEWKTMPSAVKAQLPTALPAQLAACGHQMIGALAYDASVLEQVKTALKPADNYNSAARVFGLYPLSQWFMRLGIARWQAEARERLRSTWTPTNPLQYVAATPPEGLLEPLRRSAQLLPTLHLPNDSTLSLWLGAHAPAVTVETLSEADRVGTLRAGRDGRAVVDVEQPALYVQLGSTYLLGAPRLQLIYTLWFPARSAKQWLDPYAGTLDGLIWRVTVDHKGQALAYDSIHPCGCFHMVFPAVSIDIADAAGREQPIIVPVQRPTAMVGAHIGLSGADHQIVHVEVGASSRGHVLPSQAMQWLPATDLLALRAPDGSHAGLYQANGLVVGTQRAERFYLWPSGVPSAGAMRVWGQHATAFVGRAHFDDPYLLDRWLRPATRP